MLAPVVALVLWSHVMLLWMYMTRLPAMKKARMRPDPNAVRGKQMAELPAVVRWKADNFTHLMEHPTVFYAIAIVLALVDPDNSTNIALAWTFVGIRVVHSLLQSLVNKIELRFVLFASSALVVAALTINAARVVF